MRSRTVLRLEVVVLLAVLLAGAARLDAAASIKEFGATGDGVTDDSAAIQRAVDQTRGGLVIPSGVYRLSKTIEVDLGVNGPRSLSGDGTAKFVMAGPGPAFRLTGTHGGTADPKSVKPEIWQFERTPCLDGFEVEGAHPEADGFEISGTLQPILTRLTVRSARHGIVLTKRNRNVVIAHCHLYDNSGVGLLFDQLNLHQVNVTNCHISYNGQGGLVVRRSEIRNLQIGTCDIEGNMSPAQKPTANILIDTSEGSVREVAIVGCTLQHNHEAADSANIRCIGLSAEQPQKIGHMTISDNVLSDVAVNIHLRFCRGVTITGNTLWKGFSHNVLIEDSSDIVLGPNLFDRNPDYQPADSTNSVLLNGCRDCTLTGLHLKHVLEHPALTLKNCRWSSVTNCSVFDCPAGGILLDGCEECQVSGCLIRQPQPETGARVEGLQVIAGRENSVSGNRVR